MTRLSLFLAVLTAVCATVAGDSSGAASNYPSPLKLLKTTSTSVPTSMKIGTTTGTVFTAATTTPAQNATGYYVFAPNGSSTTAAALPTIHPDATGWVLEPAGGATGFPAGPWTFTVKTQANTTTAGKAILTVGMWKGTLGGSGFTATGTIIDPSAGDDPAAQDLRAAVSQPKSTAVAYNLTKFSLAAGETLFVELWRHQTAGINDPVALDREVDLLVNDGGSAITHPVPDDTAPAHALSVTPLSGSTSYDSATKTIYYVGSGAGSFRLRDAITDSGSGPLQVTYPLVSTSGWTHAAETVSTGPTYSSSAYSWTAGSTSSPGAQSIVAEDNALQSSTRTLTLTNDTAGPTGQSVALNGGPTFTTLSVPLTLVKGTDAGAGVAGGSGVVERASATATAGSCGSFGSWAPVTLVGGADTSVATGNCYRYRYTISDVLGNTSSPSAPSADAVVDASSSSSSSSPAAGSTPAVAIGQPTEISGAGNQYFSSGTVWFRPDGAGSFALNATATGATSITFPDVSATAGWAGSTGGTDASSPFASPVAYSWTAGAVAPGSQTVKATTASGQLTGTVTISADSTPPSGQTITFGGGPFFATSVPLTIARGSDVGAGVDPAGDVVERAAAPLRSGTCGTFGPFAAVTLVNGADTSVTGGNCYRWQLKVKDNVGNVSAASTPSADAKVDSTPPTAPNLMFTGLVNAGATGNVVYYRPSTAGSFTVTAAATDAESNVTAYAFPTIPGFAQVGARASRTFDFTSSVSPPLGPLLVTATNAAGLTSPAASFTLAPDPTPPTLTARCNGAPCLGKAYAGPVTVALTGIDRAGSGLDTIRFTTNGTVPTKDAGLEYTSPMVVRSLTHLRVRAFDRAGNASNLLSLTIHSLADRLVFGAPVRLSVGPADRYLKARVSSTARAHVVAEMTGRAIKAPQRWRFILESGTWIVQLRLPETIKRGEAYSLRWTISAGPRRSTKVTQVTLR